MSVRACQFCGKPLRRMWLGGESNFCDADHRRQYQLRKGLSQLAEAGKQADAHRRCDQPKVSGVMHLCAPPGEQQRRTFGWKKPSKPSRVALLNLRPRSPIRLAMAEPACRAPRTLRPPDPRRRRLTPPFQPSSGLVLPAWRTANRSTVKRMPAGGAGAGGGSLAGVPAKGNRQRVGYPWTARAALPPGVPVMRAPEGRLLGRRMVREARLAELAACHSALQPERALRVWFGPAVALRRTVLPVSRTAPDPSGMPLGNAVEQVAAVPLQPARRQDQNTWVAAALPLAPVVDRDLRPLSAGRFTPDARMREMFPPPRPGVRRRVAGKLAGKRQAPGCTALRPALELPTSLANPTFQPGAHQPLPGQRAGRSAAAPWRLITSPNQNLRPAARLWMLLPDSGPVPAGPASGVPPAPRPAESARFLPPEGKVWRCRFLEIREVAAEGIPRWLGGHNGVPRPLFAAPRRAPRRASEPLDFPFGANGPVLDTVALDQVGDLTELLRAIPKPVKLEESFQSGLGDWTGQTRDWKMDFAGARPASLLLWTPSMGVSDYELEFYAHIEKRAVTAVVRARGEVDHYRIAILAPQPGVAHGTLERTAVIGGTAEPAEAVALPEGVPGKGAFAVRVRVERDRYAVAVEGKQVACWNDARLATGGIGFLAAGEDRARLYWVRLTSPCAAPAVEHRG